MIYNGMFLLLWPACGFKHFKFAWGKEKWTHLSTYTGILLEGHLATSETFHNSVGTFTQLMISTCDLKILVNKSNNLHHLSLFFLSPAPSSLCRHLFMELTFLACLKQKLLFRSHPPIQSPFFYHLPSFGAWEQRSRPPPASETC